MLILHRGGYTTRRFDVSGFKEFRVMHIPLATFPLTSLVLKKLKLSCRRSDGEADGEASVKDGSRTSFWLNMSWPEANRTPL
jgi:hypothetical protein